MADHEDGPGRTRLHTLCAAAEFGDTELAELRELVSAGADATLVDSFERAPLSLLCMNSGHVEAAAALLAAGAAPASRDAWGRTSLHWCCDRGWLVVAELLLRSGAPVNACTKQGDTPLLWAAKSGHVKVVELLLKSGADTLVRNNRDEAALDVASDEVVRTLISSAVVPEKTTTAEPAVPEKTTTTEQGVPEQTTTTELTGPASSVQRAEAEDAQPEKAVDVMEKAPVSLESGVPRTTTTATSLGSRALAGLPKGGKVGTSGGVLFSAYNKQPLSSSSGWGSGLGPKKMKITLKKK